MTTEPRTILVTGFPGSLLARRLLARVAASEREARLVVITSAPQVERAQAEWRRLGDPRPERLEVVVGDPSAMDMGLSGARFVELARRVDVVHHCAFATDASMRRELLERANVGATGEVLELCEASERRSRLVLWSTTGVCGLRRGLVLEGELPERTGFSNAVDETRYRAERMVREAMEHVPTTILRPSIVVGDSKTGEIDRMEGPYLLILLMLGSPVDLRVPLPGRGDVPLNLVPIDYVVDAGHAIASDPRSIGRTFHLVDEHPATARRVFELIAQAAGRPGPVGSLPSQLATAVLRTPGLERFSHIPRAFLEQLATEVTYDARNTRELLDGTGLCCPRAASYLEVMVDYVRSRQRKRSERAAPKPADVAEDALD